MSNEMESGAQIDAPRLRELAAQRDESAAKGCTCAALRCAAWESITDDRWPAGIDKVGTLRAPDIDEPTFEEFHPGGTRYDSPQAPIAPEWFPFNRCDVYRCTRCLGVFLRYTEYGGYYIDHRVRRVDPALIVA